MTGSFTRCGRCGETPKKGERTVSIKLGIFDNEELKQVYHHECFYTR